MSITYKEIKDCAYIDQCADLHNSVFNISGEDSFPKAFFQMIIRKEAALGILIGCFKNNGEKEDLIGLCVALSTMEERTLHCSALCVHPNHQNGLVGYRLLQNLKEISLSKGFRRVYSAFNCADPVLVKLYTKLGNKVVRILSEKGAPGSIKAQTQWDLCDQEHHAHVEDMPTLEEALSEIPLGTCTIHSPRRLLVKYPVHGNHEAVGMNKFQQEIQSLQGQLELLINSKAYAITYFLSKRLDGSNCAYYLLERQKNESSCHSQCRSWESIASEVP